MSECRPFTEVSILETDQSHNVLYLVDSTPCDFVLSPKLKLQLKGRRSDTVEAIQTESQAVSHTFVEADYQTIFEEWKKCCDWCICVSGDYFEGESNQEFVKVL